VTQPQSSSPLLQPTLTMVGLAPPKSDHPSSALNQESVQAADLSTPSPFRRAEQAEEVTLFLTILLSPQSTDIIDSQTFL
jgi:hypothetical protein